MSIICIIIFNLFNNFLLDTFFMRRNTCVNRLVANSISVSYFCWWEFIPHFITRSFVNDREAFTKLQIQVAFGFFLIFLGFSSCPPSVLLVTLLYICDIQDDRAAFVWCLGGCLPILVCPKCLVVASSLFFVKKIRD